MPTKQPDELEDKIRNIEDFFRHGFPRGVGHTNAMLEGANNVPNCVIVVANLAMARRMIGNPLHRTILTITDIENGKKWKSLRAPIVFDHYALQELMWRLSDYHKALQERAVREAKIEENDYHWHRQKHITQRAKEGTISGYFLERQAELQPKGDTEDE